MTDLYTGALPNVRGRRFPVIYLTPEILLAPEIQNGSGGLGVVAGSYMVELGRVDAICLHKGADPVDEHL